MSLFVSHAVGVCTLSLGASFCVYRDGVCWYDQLQDY